MQIKIAARHGHLSAENQALIQAKAEKLLHYFDRITLIEVMVDLADTEAHQKTVEVKVDAEHKHDFVAIEKVDDLMIAVDAAMDKVRAQIHKYKEKIQDHRRDRAMNGDAPHK